MYYSAQITGETGGFPPTVDVDPHVMHGVEGLGAAVLPH